MTYTITITDILTAIGVLIAGLSLFAGMLMYRRQLNTQIFVEYTKRYDELMEDWDKITGISRTKMLKDPDPPKSDEITRQALRYLNMCAEEFYLFHRSLLYRKTWKIWKKELIYTVSSPLFMREWKTLIAAFNSYEDFQKFINKKMKKAAEAEGLI